MVIGMLTNLDLTISMERRFSVIYIVKTRFTNKIGNDFITEALI